jgi:hypothetical protein
LIVPLTFKIKTLSSVFLDLSWSADIQGPRVSSSHLEVIIKGGVSIDLFDKVLTMAITLH